MICALQQKSTGSNPYFCSNYLHAKNPGCIPFPDDLYIKFRTTIDTPPQVGSWYCDRPDAMGLPVQVL
jgi:hypothetical protein